MLNDSYIMESPREAGRLRRKVNAADFVEQYLDPIISSIKITKKRQPVRVLDAGCGSGIITAEIAKKYPGVEVYGIDLSCDRFEFVRRKNKDLSNLYFRQANIKKLPFEPGFFDLAFTRFLLEYMASPQSVINELVRRLRKGGRLFLQDLDGQLITHYPLSPEFGRQMNAIIKSMNQTGFDPFIGRKLYSFAKKAELQKIAVTMEPYHFYAGRIDSKNYQLWKTKLEVAMPMLIKALGTKSKAIAFKKKYLDYLLDKNTLSFSTVFSVTGKK